MHDGFDPNSFDAQVATILQMLKSQNENFEKKCIEDRTAFEKMLAKQDKTNGRVTQLESDAAYAKGKAAGIAALCSVLITGIAWLIQHLS